MAPWRVFVFTEATYPKKCKGLGGGALHKFSTQEIQKTVDHEIIEALVDPYQNRSSLNFTIDGRLVEIADPVGSQTYKTAKGITMSDFVYPSYCLGGKGPYDPLGAWSRSVPKGDGKC